MKLAENDSIGDEEDRTNEQGFTGMDVIRDKTLGYEKKEKQPTAYASDR